MRHLFTLLLALSYILSFAQSDDVIRVACIGNSITEGYALSDPSTQAYPARLQQLLGADFCVMNYGHSSKTLMRSTDHSYMDEKQRQLFRRALASQPDIVTIKLGTNDSKTPYDSLLHADFTRDLHTLIDSFMSVPSRPYIYLMLPIPAVSERWGIRDSVIQQEVIPRIQAVAQERHLPIIDLYSALLPFPELLEDQIHPNAAGTMIIAEEVARRILLDRARGLIHYGAESHLNPAYSGSTERH